MRIWSHLLNKSLMENFIFCAVRLKCSKVKNNIAPKIMKELLIPEIKPQGLRNNN